MKKHQKAGKKNKRGVGGNTIARRTRRKGLFIALAVVGVLMISAWLGYLWLDKELRYNLYSQPKSEARQDLADVVADINFPGKLVSNFIEDNGCTETKVSIQTYHSCSLLAKKYYVRSGNPSEGLRHMHDSLVSKGWLLGRSINVEYLEESYFLGTSPGSLSYYHPGDKPGLYTSYYPANYDSGNNINDLLKLDKTISLNKDEYIYGVTVGNTYWSCSKGHLLWPNQNCPDAPSSVKN